MKKVFMCVLALVMGLSMFACASTPAAAPAAATEAPAAATEAAQSAIGNDPIESKDMADFAGYIVLNRTATDWIDSISKEFAVLKYSEMSKCIEWRRENKEWNR